MRRKGIIIVAAVLGSAPAVAQPSRIEPEITETVTLNSFDPSTNTYTAQVRVQARPCPDIAYDVLVPVGGVKDGDDAKDKAKPEVTRILKDIQLATAKCIRH